MVKELLFGENGIIAWSGFLSVLYLILGSHKEVKKYIVIGWAVVIATLILSLGFGLLD
jgi:hypothetical protein